MTTALLSVLHMLNGQMLLGKIVSEDATYVTVEQPLNIMVQQDRASGSIQIGLSPVGFPLFSDAKKQPKQVQFNRAAISFLHSLDLTSPEMKQLADSHAATFSSILLNTGARVQMPTRS